MVTEETSQTKESERSTSRCGNTGADLSQGYYYRGKYANGTSRCYAVDTEEIYACGEESDAEAA